MSFGIVMMFTQCSRITKKIFRPNSQQVGNPTSTTSQLKNVTVKTEQEHELIFFSFKTFDFFF
jgi:hypothetical protein